jgi:hypothetical protein
MGSWTKWLELILKFLSFLSDQQKADLKADMTAAVKKVKVGGADDAEGNTYAALRATLDKTPLVKIRQRNFLRWALHTVPDAAAGDAKALPKAAVTEGKSLAAAMSE